MDLTIYLSFYILFLPAALSVRQEGIYVHSTLAFATLAVIFSLIAIMLVLLGFFLYEHKRVQTARENLESELGKSTQQVKEQNVLLKAQNAEVLKQKAELEEYVRRLEAMTKDRKQLYTNLIHGLKTPMTLIKAPVENLRNLIGGESSLVDESLGIISRSSDEMLSLVTRMLESSDSMDPDIKVVNTSFSLSALAELFAKDYAMVMDRKNVALNVLSRIGSDWVITDRNALYQIVSFLLITSIKYTHEGGSVSCYVVEFDAEESGIMVSVHIHGSDLTDKEWAARLSVADGFVGSHAPYSIDDVVKALGGRFSYHGCGSDGIKLRIIVPVGIDAKRNRDNDRDVNENAVQIPARPTVLLVEDNDDMRLYVKSLLGSEYDVIEASNGMEAYDAALNRIPDLIISDLMMPVCDGVQLCRKIRGNDNTSDIPFLMLTALSDDDTRQMSYAVGVDSFMSKPFTSGVLRTRITSLLESRRRKRADFVSEMIDRLEPVALDDDTASFRSRLLLVLESRYKDPSFGAFELQDALCLGSTSFFKKVKDLTGVTPGQLIRIYRLQIARKTLEEHKGVTSFRIADCAYAVGFSDPNYFSRCYYRQFGEHPKDTLSL